MSRSYIKRMPAIVNRIQTRKILNILLFFALLLTSCGPAPAKTPQAIPNQAARSTPISPKTPISQSSPKQPSQLTRPQFSRPKPITAQRPQQNKPTLATTPQPKKSGQTPMPVSQQATPTPWTNNPSATPTPWINDQEATPTPMPDQPTPIPSQEAKPNLLLPQTMVVGPIQPDSDCSDGECVFWVSASADDAGPDPSCNYSTSRNEIYFGECTGQQGITSGFRFPNVNFPKGAKVQEAYIEFSIDGPYTNNLTLNIYGEATGNSASFTTSNRPSNRVLTQASASWDIPSTDDWEWQQMRNSPDLTSIVQEIVDRSDWNPGNAMAIIVENAGPASGSLLHRRVIGYDRDSSNAARLVIKGGPVVHESAVVNPPPGGDGCACDEGGESAQANANATIAGPINTRTGGLSYEAEDITIPTDAGQLGFQRTYSSLSTDIYSDKLGYGWTDSLDTRLILPDDPEGEEGFVLFKLHSANRYEFIDNGNDTYTPGPGVTGSLTYADEVYTLTLPDQSVYTFDNDGFVQTRADSEGRTWEYVYDNGHLVQVNADGGDRYLALTYDGQGRIETVSDHTERSVTFGYDEAGDLVSATDVSGGEWQYEYDSAHHLTEVINPLQQTVEQTEYDSQGRAVRQWDGANDQVVDITYNLDGTSTLVDARENTTTHTYDSRNTLVGNTNALASTVSKKYNANFRPIQVTDPLAHETDLTWSADGANLTQIVDAQGNQTDITYDGLNQPLSVIDPMTFPTYYEYDGTRLTGVTDALQGETTYTYTTEGYLESVTDPLNRTTSYTYDDFGQRISMTDPSDKTWTYAYDDLGRLTDTADPTQHVTHNEYDSAGRLVRVTRNYDTNHDQNEDNQYNLVTEYQYDQAGNQIAVTDTYGVITRTYYDEANRPVTVVQNLTDQSIDTTTPPECGSGLTDENLCTNTVYDSAGNVIASINPNGVITRTYYDEANRPVTVVQNLFGQSVETETPPTFDPDHPDRNVRTDTTYDAGGNAIATTDTNGVITRTFYDELNRPVTVVRNLTGQSIETATPPTCGTGLSLTNICTKTNYDKNGNVIAVTDPLGIITRTYYDELNRPITVVQNLTGQAISAEEPPEGEFGNENVRTDTYYDAGGQAIAVVDPMGIITRTYYDDSGRPVTVVRNLVGQDPYVDTPPTCGTGMTDENICTTTAYDDLGRQIATTDPLGHVTKYDYNDAGQLERVTANFLDGQAQNYQNQYNIVTEYAYDALGRLLTTTDTLGRVTATTYDDLGRTIASTQNVDAGQSQNYQNQYNITTAFAYDPAGAQIATTDPLGMITRTYYDALGRAVSKVRNLDGQGIETGTLPERGEGATNQRVDTVYDRNGQAIATVNELEKTTAFGYDSLGRQTEVDDPLDNATQSVYDVAGRLSGVTDAKGVVTHYGYDPLGRLTDVWENYKPGFGQDAETNVHTVYTYDANGNRLTLQDGNGQVTVFAYDGLNRLHTETDPLEHTWMYSYDVAGNRLEMVDANEATTSYTYDALNRLVLIDYPSPDPDVTFDYNAIGLRLSMTDGQGTTTWTYDALNRPLTTTDPFDNTVAYTYNALGNRVSLTYPDNKVVSYTYDSAQRLDEISLDSTNIAQYSYDAGGHVTGVTRANGVDTTYAYDDAGRLTQLEHASGAKGLASYTYEYDEVGNRTSVDETYQQPDLDFVFDDGFESGDLSAWSNSVTGDGNLSATAAAAIEGNYGLQATVAGQTDFYVQDESPAGDAGYRSRFYFDPDSVTIPNEEHVDLFSAQDATLGTAFYVRLRAVDGEYQIAAIAVDDNQQETETDWYTLTNSPHAVELAWQAASSSGAGNGSLALWIDGEEAEQLSGIDNDTLRINEVRLGVMSPSSTAISGSIYFDAFRSNRKGAIGLDPAIPVPASSEQIQSDAFESGDFSAWSGAVTDGGNLSINQDAAIEGDYGMEAVADANNEMYVLDQGPYLETNYDARFYFIPNTIDIPEGGYLDLFEGRDINGEVAFSLRLREMHGDYYVKIVAGDDAQQNVEGTWIPITNEAHAIELAWLTASSSGAGNGSLAMWVDGDEKGQLGSIDNATRRIDEVRLGILSPSTLSPTVIDGSIYFDDFASGRTGYIGLDSNIPTPAPLPEQITNDAFESGDLSAWSSAVTDGGDLSVSSAAALEGDYGLQAVINDDHSLYVLDNQPFGVSHYRARFYIDPNSVSIPNHEGFAIFSATDTNGDPDFEVHMRSVYGEYQLEFIALDDTAQSHTTGWIPITDAPHAIEVEWWAAPTSTSGDGFFFFWVDGAQRGQLQNLSNFAKPIDTVQMGVISPSSGDIDGTVYFDDFSSNRAGYYIDINPNIPVPDPLTDTIFADAFESGDLSAWSSAVTDDGDLSVSSTAALEGDYGLQAVINDNHSLYVIDQRSFGVSHYRGRFYIDPNSVSIPDHEGFTIFSATDINGDPAFEVHMRSVYGEYQLEFIALDDTAQSHTTGWIPITDEPHAIEVEWCVAPTSTSGDGFFFFWMDGMLRGQLQNLSNFAKPIDTVQMGVISPSTASIQGTVYFDDFSSNRAGNYVDIDPNIPVPDPLPDTVFSDAFESGDLSAWSGAVTDDGDLSVSSAAAMEGSYGLQAVVNDQTEIYVHDERPMSEPVYHARFYFDPNSVEMPEGATFEFFRGLSYNAGTAFYLQLGMVNGDYAIRSVMVDDNQQPVESDWIPVSDAPHLIEMEWWRAWSADVSDGRVLLWIDGNGGQLPQVADNDTMTIDAVEMGAMALSTASIAGTVYFDDLTSIRYGNAYIGADPNVTLPPSDPIFSDGFESGDLSGWDSAQTDSGDLSVTTDAALFDTYGLQAVVDDDSPMFVQDNSPLAERHYRARFYFDPNSIAIPDGDSLVLFEGRDLSAGTVFQVSLRYSDDAYQVGASLVDDNQTNYATDWSTITDDVHALEVEWARASDAESSNGFAILWVDGESVGSVGSVDNDTLRVDNVRLGVLSPSSANISGTLYIDDFASNRDEYVGLEGQEQRSTQLDNSGETVQGGPGENAATATPAVVPTFTSTPTPTPTPMPTPTPTPTRVATSAPTSTSTPRPSATPTFTPGMPTQGAVPLKITPVRTLLPASKNARTMGAQAVHTGVVTQTIDYTYDPLNRLTSADYSDGDSYSYTYDAVGNRLSQDDVVGGLPTSLEYTYDEANRLTAVGSVSYTWDANGNLLNDGVNTYTYDSANRLTAVSNAQSAVSYTYNGLGDRLQQTVNDVTTTYVNDLNSGLTQVLSDGTNTYLYGNDRIAQLPAEDPQQVDYFLGDALGSVRQMADESGAVVYAASYDPYGNVLSTNGDAQTSYGYANEYTDSYIKLIDLRSRWYDPYLNQFIQPDTIVPDPRIPADWNKYTYTRDNPLKYTDPSGFCSNVGVQVLSSINCAIGKPAPDYSDPELIHQDQLFSEVFKGTGLNGAWTNSDWDYYYHNRGKIYRDSTTWLTQYPAAGWDLFAYHVERLATHYSSNQQDQFVRDFASLFGGVPALGSYISATWASRHGPALHYNGDYSFIREGVAGLSPIYLDSINKQADQSHHYAGSFFQGYFWGSSIAYAALAAENIYPLDKGDILLGWAAVTDASMFLYMKDLTGLAALIRAHETDTTVPGRKACQ